jgi:hypothetical protein
MVACYLLVSLGFDSLHSLPGSLNGSPSKSIEQVFMNLSGRDLDEQLSLASA